MHNECPQKNPAVQCPAPHLPVTSTQIPGNNAAESAEMSRFAQASFNPGQSTFAQNWQYADLQQPQMEEIGSNAPVENAPVRS